tara:strand:+ start:5311 stop:6204 length:894 start_codon:yes stop_codon:yes gene_type:complete
MKLKKLPFSVYDCFTKYSFGGNVGAIVWNANNLNKDQMQNIAKEFNAPVTGYVIKEQGNIVTVRFFMPTSEINMCGHVTIGLFTDLSMRKINYSQKYKLKVPSGDIEVCVKKNENNIPTVMFSIDVPLSIKINLDLLEIAEALQVSISDINSSIPVEAYDSGIKHLFINLIDEEKLKTLSPNFEYLKDISRKIGIQTIACFTFKESELLKKIKIRDFCPILGVNETPASGTTNAALTAYLLNNDLITKHSQTIIAEQGNEIGRPSKIFTELEVDNDLITNLKIGGNAILSYSGNVQY